MRIEFACGLVYGTLSDMQIGTKTAEEIKASKQRSYSTVVDIQKALKKALIDTIDAMSILRNFYLNKPIIEPETSFDFDDSLIVDTATEQTIKMQEVAVGLIKPEKYLEWRYGVTESEALEMLPNQNNPNSKDNGIE